MKYTYKTRGTCSTQINVDIGDDLTINDIQFIGGCNGNLQGIAKLVTGMDIDTVIEKLQGIECGFKKTSCPDQLAKALTEIKKEL